MGNVMVIPARRQVGNTVKQSAQKKLRVAAYCRVSTDSEEQETSYEAQVTHYTEYIQKNPEWELAGIFADDGISGTNTKKRDEFNRMIDECMAGNIDMVITKSISRFARNTLDCLQYIRQLKDKNIPVYFEKEAINTLDAKGEVLITIMASLAQQNGQEAGQRQKLRRVAVEPEAFTDAMAQGFLHLSGVEGPDDEAVQAHLDRLQEQALGGDAEVDVQDRILRDRAADDQEGARLRAREGQVELRQRGAHPDEGQDLVAFLGRDEPVAERLQVLAGGDQGGHFHQLLQFFARDRAGGIVAPVAPVPAEERVQGQVVPLDDRPFFPEFLEFLFQIVVCHMAKIRIFLIFAL